jgi:hypothetical protein
VKFNKAIIPGLVIFSTLSSNSALALPIDWNGVFGVDTHLLNNIRRTGDQFTKFDNNNDRATGTDGTQGIQSGEQGAHFQTYIFKLSPQIIVNDAVTFKSELSTGYIRGGFLGGDVTSTQDGTGSNAYYFTTPAQRSGLNINQAYMELYADTALIRLGRMSKHYGTGAILNGGNQAWDRFLTIYDGIDAEMKIGNFSLTPHWAKISSFNQDLRDGQGGADATRNADVREMGLIAKYDNRNRDLVVSVLFARRYSEFGNSLYQSNQPDLSVGTVRQGRTEITIIDPYIAKKWNRLTVALEAPMISGNFGNAFGTTPASSSSISANSYILEARYDLGPKWDVGLFAGQISGTQGSGAFGATYLHPNYQVADLMFRYHWQSFNEPTGRSIFDSSITNSRYLRAFGNYKTDKWTFKSALIMARAMETANAGSRAYHHEENYSYNARADQSNNMGFELDFGFDYRWNPNVIISGYYGYWFVGDYYSFTNSTTTLGLQNVHGGGVRATLEF